MSEKFSDYLRPSMTFYPIIFDYLRTGRTTKTMHGHIWPNQGRHGGLGWSNPLNFILSLSQAVFKDRIQLTV